MEKIAKVLVASIIVMLTISVCTLTIRNEHLRTTLTELTKATDDLLAANARLIEADRKLKAVCDVVAAQLQEHRKELERALGGLGSSGNGIRIIGGMPKTRRCPDPDASTEQYVGMDGKTYLHWCDGGDAVVSLPETRR